MAIPMELEEYLKLEDIRSWKTFEAGSIFEACRNTCREC
jgi:hypothetical protein